LEIVYKGVKDAFKDIVAQNFKCLAIVPKEMTESWLLYDPNAYPQIPSNPALPTRPEELWGEKHNPNSKYPKNYMKKILSQFPEFDSINEAESYTKIAKKTNIQVILHRNSKSFKQFYDDMQEFITPEGTAS
jgi:hypothetical protein